MDFGDALVYLKEGQQITRKVWGGKTLYISPRTDGFGNTIYFTLPKGGEGIYIPSNTDILATDWEVLKVPVLENVVNVQDIQN